MVCVLCRCSGVTYCLPSSHSLLVPLVSRSYRDIQLFHSSKFSSLDTHRIELHLESLHRYSTFEEGPFPLEQRHETVKIEERDAKGVMKTRNHGGENYRAFIFSERIGVSFEKRAGYTLRIK